MKRYWVWALLIHAGALGLAFTQYRIHDVHGVIGPTSLNSELAVQRTQTPALDEALSPPDLPEVEIVRPAKVARPRDAVLPPEAPSSELQAPGHTPPPENTLTDIRPDRAGGAFVARNDAPASEPPEPATKKGSQAKPEASSAANHGIPGADDPPRLLNRNWPDLLRQGFEGQVLVKVVVAPQGHAVSVKILDGTGNANWDKQLTRMFRLSPYAPGRINGQPILCKHNFRITFKRK